MAFDKLEYQVAEMMGPPQSLLINSDGSARYESHSDNSTSENPEIGVYEAKVPAAELQKLQHQFAGPEFQGLPDHWGRVASGDRYKRITLNTGGKKIEKMVGSTGTVDPRLAVLIQELDKIVMEVMRHPRQNLRMELSNVGADKFGSFSADFKLSNQGTEPTNCFNPIGLAGGPNLSVRGWADKMPPQYAAGEVFRVNAERVTVLPGAATEDEASPVLRISPGGTASFHVVATLTVPRSGPYLLQLAYQNTSQTVDGVSLLVGELFSKATRIDLQASTRR